MTEALAANARHAFELADNEPAAPIWLVPLGGQLPVELDDAAVGWLEMHDFKGQAKKTVLVPARDGSLLGVACGIGDGTAGDPSGPSELLLGMLAASLPARTYRIATPTSAPDLAAIAWGLGGYRFARYKSGKREAQSARLKMPDGCDEAHVLSIVEAVALGRDLINTPAADLGPLELESAARDLAGRHGAVFSTIAGDDLLAANFPMIHAVGRANPRAPRLVDFTWGPEDGRKITLVGKGITFDTGGLDIKPSSGMLLMKKDMGGAATTLALAHMIMSAGLHCRLRVILAVAENSISGDAFRPGDVLQSRAGLTVEVGNTDAEGRLVLADALALADEDRPECIMVFATLTGAARVALGPDLPAFFTDDDQFAGELTRVSAAIGDPVWRLPLWDGYRRHLDSDVADTSNVWESPFAGSITAALFLRRFVSHARRFVHFDLYGWRLTARPLGPKGGEPQTARAAFEILRMELAG